MKEKPSRYCYFGYVEYDVSKPTGSFSLKSGRLGLLENVLGPNRAGNTEFGGQPPLSVPTFSRRVRYASINEIVARCRPSSTTSFQFERRVARIRPRFARRLA